MDRNNNYRGKLMIELVKKRKESEINNRELKNSTLLKSSEELGSSSELDFSPEHSEYNPSNEEGNTSDSAQESPDFSILTPLRKRKSTFKKNSGRKRKAVPGEWEKNKLKQALNLGLKHKMRSGKIKPARQMKSVCSCKLKCFEKFSSDERLAIFKNFWKLGDKMMQWQFILEHSQSFDKKTSKINPKIKREVVRQYFLKKYIDSELKEIQVCQQMFMNTVDINKQWITTAFKKRDAHIGVLKPDTRGRHVRSVNEIVDNLKDHVRSHIMSFPAVESHYVRKSSTKKFLSPDLNIAKMYRLFQEKLKDENLENINISQRQYHDIFVKEFNIAFHKPRKDQCNICEAYNNLVETERTNKSEDYQNHLRNKDTARELKNVDKLRSTKSGGKIKVVCYDFQKQLVCPQADTSIFYYKRNFLSYNFTLFELGSSDVTCFVWDEKIAGKGSCEVASCLNLYLKKLKDTDEIIFYSDNCPSQNKNKVVFSFYVWCSKTYNIKIIHRFLEQGHTQNEADGVHAAIERERKGKNIYVPNQWYMLIQCARKTGKPYQISEVVQEDIFNFKNLTQCYYLEKDTNFEKIAWSKIKEVLALPNEPNKIFVKYNFDEEYKTINLTTKKRAKKINNFTLEKLYKCPLSITKSKYRDLQYLCEKNFIPRNYHDFYNKLTFVETVPEIQNSESESGDEW